MAHSIEVNLSPCKTKVIMSTRMWAQRYDIPEDVERYVPGLESVVAGLRMGIIYNYHYNSARSMSLRIREPTNHVAFPHLYFNDASWYPLDSPVYIEQLANAIAKYINICRDVRLSAPMTGAVAVSQVWAGKLYTEYPKYELAVSAPMFRLSVTEPTTYEGDSEMSSVNLTTDNIRELAALKASPGSYTVYTAKTRDGGHTRIKIYNHRLPILVEDAAKFIPKMPVPSAATAPCVPVSQEPGVEHLDATGVPRSDQPEYKAFVTKYTPAQRTRICYNAYGNGATYDAYSVKLSGFNESYVARVAYYVHIIVNDNSI